MDWVGGGAFFMPRSEGVVVAVVVVGFDGVGARRGAARLVETLRIIWRRLETFKPEEVRL